MKVIQVIALVSLVAAAGPGRAEDQPGRVSAPDQARAFELYLKATRTGGPALGDAMLEGLRGGADWHTSEIWSSAQVGQNEAANLSTGSNFVNGGALTSTSGFPTVVQNSGNNVLIQNSTIINLHMQ
jgi:hypothetical protein